MRKRKEPKSVRGTYKQVQDLVVERFACPVITCEAKPGRECVRDFEPHRERILVAMIRMARERVGFPGYREDESLWSTLSTVSLPEEVTSG